MMGRVAAGAALIALLSAAPGCSSSSTPASAPSAPLATTVTVSSPAAATTHPASPLSPDGFGAKPPTVDQLHQLGEWMDGPGARAKRAINDASSGLDQFHAASGATQLRSACQSITDPLTIRLPASLPTPDPDMTNGLQFVIDDAQRLATACAKLSADSPSADVETVVDAIHQLGTDTATVGTIMDRNGDLLASTANGG